MENAEIDKIIQDYAKKPIMPNEHKTTLIEACVSGNVKVVEKYLHEYRIDVASITGKME